MGNSETPWTDIDRRINGQEFRVGELDVTPVGRLRGKMFCAGGERGGFAGMKVTLTPEEIVVRRDGDEQVVAIEAPDRRPLRVFLMAGVGVMAVCLLVMILAQRVAARRG